MGQPQWDVSGLLTHLNKLHNEEVAAAKRDLAEKVLRVVEREERSRFGEAATGISSAVRDLFAESGIELTTPQDKEGE